MACESTSDVSGVISEFIAFHADLDARNRLGDTPLHRAAQLGKDGICMQLVQVRTDILPVPLTY
jgi:ankyrin repeat protein